MTPKSSVHERDRKRIEQFVGRALELWKVSQSAGEEIRDCPADDAAHFLELKSGAAVSLTLPGLSLKTFVRWLGRRIIWWPNGIEYRRRISIMSSRLPRRKDLHQHWFDALRTAAVQADPETECFVTVHSTTAADAVSRAAALFRLPLLQVEICEQSEDQLNSIAVWLHSESATSSSNLPLGRSAILSAAYTGDSETSFPFSQSTRDSALACAGQRILSLSCREGGNVHAILQRRLADRPIPPVLILRNENDRTKSSIPELQAAGAVPWLLHGSESEPSSSKSTSSKRGVLSQSSNHEVTNLEGPLLQPEDWLCHWTRECAGPWPDESNDDYLDALILNCPSADHSAVAALMRIVETGILLPSQLSRNSVSFTQVPLSQFRSHRVYRRHLRRYDFEPWGIAVKQIALAQLGCRPVKYFQQENDTQDDGPDWHLQPATDASHRIDWTREREWRLPAAIHLSDISKEDVVVFVDTIAEAKVLGNVSPWRVLTVPNAGDAT